MLKQRVLLLQSTRVGPMGTLHISHSKGILMKQSVFILTETLALLQSQQSVNWIRVVIILVVHMVKLLHNLLTLTCTLRQHRLVAGLNSLSVPLATPKLSILTPILSETIMKCHSTMIARL